VNVPDFPKTFPRLETGRLILRQISADDRLGIFRNFSDPEVAKWFFEEPYTRMEQVDEIIQAFSSEFEQGKGLTWAIALKGSHVFVGTCGYGEVELGARGEIGFDLAKGYWGRGLMSEALGAIVSYGFEVLGLDKVEAHTYSANARAIRLLEKLGFRLEKVGDDAHYFALSRKDRRDPAHRAGHDWSGQFKAMAAQGDDALLDGDVMVPTALDEP
jgi:ribosomal-protein-alanine N-acetyltransferase